FRSGKAVQRYVPPRSYNYRCSYNCYGTYNRRPYRGSNYRDIRYHGGATNVTVGTVINAMPMSGNYCQISTVISISSRGYEEMRETVHWTEVRGTYRNICRP